jgi:hypothetical protein
MLRDIDNYFLQQEEPARGCLDFLRHYILALDVHITEAWKYRMPFYCYNGKMCCYLWVQKKTGIPYIGIVEGDKMHHPGLIAEKRSRMKILLIDPSKDIPIKEIKGILEDMLKLYR